MQPYLFPYIAYFQLIAAVDVFVSYDDVQYIKGGWINRNNFLLNGRPYLFTFGVRKDSTFLRINERCFAENHEHQVMKFMRLLRASYSSAPYFSAVYGLVDEILCFDDTNVARKIQYSLVRLCQYLEIPTRLEVSSQLNIAPSLSGQDRIIAICRALGIQHYINAIGGRDLYSREAFSKEDITLSFLKSLPIVYDQHTSSFVPNLSILDVMMFNSIDQIRKFLSMCVLL